MPYRRMPARGRITKIRGRTLTIDKGADDGLEVGLEVTIVRLPDEAIIHPLTEKNLGAPEIEIAGGHQQGLRPRRLYSTRQQSDPLDPTWRHGPLPDHGREDGHGTGGVDGNGGAGGT